VNLLAAEPLLHLRVDLERRPRVLVTDLPHHVRERCRSSLDELTAAFSELADVSGILTSELRRSWRPARVG
jgi:hypothetical protein